MIGETGERKSAVATPDGKSRKKKKKKFSSLECSKKKNINREDNIREHQKVVKNSSKHSRTEHQLKFSSNILECSSPPIRT